MVPDKQRLSTADRSNLVAYLDGELNEAEANALQGKLTQSVTARREIEAYEKTWELLDYLPLPRVADDFTSRTMTEVKLIAARGGDLVDVAGRSARVAARVLVCAAIMLLTLGIGYISSRWLWPDPTARLVRDLSLAEHLDEYREVGSLEFLKLLDESPAFNDNGD